jgi:alkylation response protein AidB-like acyl-CoA dehydrogenase
MGMDVPVNAQAALAITGADGVIWAEGEDGGMAGLNWIKCRGQSIAGGTNEMQRNIVSERLLGLPREPGPDKGLPFSELQRLRGAK